MNLSVMMQGWMDALTNTQEDHGTQLKEQLTQLQALSHIVEITLRPRLLSLDKKVDHWDNQLSNVEKSLLAQLRTLSANIAAVDRKTDELPGLGVEVYNKLRDRISELEKWANQLRGPYPRGFTPPVPDEPQNPVRKTIEDYLEWCRSNLRHPDHCDKGYYDLVDDYINWLERQK